MSPPKLVFRKIRSHCFAVQCLSYHALQNVTKIKFAKCCASETDDLKSYFFFKSRDDARDVIETLSYYKNGMASVSLGDFHTKFVGLKCDIFLPARLRDKNANSLLIDRVYKSLYLLHSVKVDQNGHPSAESHINRVTHIGG